MQTHCLQFKLEVSHQGIFQECGGTMFCQLQFNHISDSTAVHFFLRRMHWAHIFQPSGQITSVSENGHQPSSFQFRHHTRYPPVINRGNGKWTVYHWLSYWNPHRYGILHCHDYWRVHHFITSYHHSQIIHVWYIYLQNWVIYGVNVGKYTSTMDDLGLLLLHSSKSWVAFSLYQAQQHIVTEVTPTWNANWPMAGDLMHADYKITHKIYIYIYTHID